MSDAERIASFIALAEEELSAARLLMSGAPRQAVQQAAEKATRAVLTAAGVPFGTSHNLGQMAAALPPAHPMRMAINALDKDSSAATKYRYPSPAGRLANARTSKEVASAIDEVAAFIAQVKDYFRTIALRPDR